MNPKLNPYLNFMGETKEAMEFYHSVFGGELKMQSFKEAGFPHNPEDDDKIIHASLINNEINLMASDGDEKHQVTMGNNINLSLTGNNEELLTGWFNKLSEGGKVNMALEKQFWGDIYGQITDKFGVNWMVNISKQ